MSQITWPTELPQEIVLAGNAEEQTNPVIRTRIGSGRPSQRRLADVTYEFRNCEMWLDDDQFTNFKDFWENSVTRGQDWFNFPYADALAGATVNQRVRFVGEYASRRQKDGLWHIAFTIEREAVRRLTKAQLDAIINPIVQGDWDPADWFEDDWGTEAPMP